MKFTAVAVFVALVATVASASCVDLSESTECPDWEVSIPFPGGSVAVFDASVQATIPIFTNATVNICPSSTTADFTTPKFKKYICDYSVQAFAGGADVSTCTA
jgi:hypothetical protein